MLGVDVLGGTGTVAGVEVVGGVNVGGVLVTFEIDVGELAGPFCASFRTSALLVVGGG